MWKCIPYRMVCFGRETRPNWIKMDRRRTGKSPCARVCNGRYLRGIQQLARPGASQIHSPRIPAEGPSFAISRACPHDRSSDFRALLETNAVHLPDWDSGDRCRGALPRRGPHDLGERARAVGQTRARAVAHGSVSIDDELRLAAAGQRQHPPSRVECRSPSTRSTISSLEARSEVRGAFERVAQTTDMSFSYEAIEGGLVERCQDETERRGGFRSIARECVSGSARFRSSRSTTSCVRQTIWG